MADTELEPRAGAGGDVSDGEEEDEPHHSHEVGELEMGGFRLPKAEGAADDAAKTRGVRRHGDKRHLACCLCRRSQPRSAFSPYFCNNNVDPAVRRCVKCTELGLKNAYRQTARTFGDTRGSCSVFEAARVGNVYRVLSDLRSGAVSINDYDRTTGRTLLHETVAAGDVLLTEALVFMGVDLDRRSLVSRETPLFSAVSNDRPRLVLLLLAYNCRTDLRDKRYATALHYVESAEVAALLLRMAHMDIDAVNGKGESVMEMVRRRVGVDSGADVQQPRGRSRSLIMAMAAEVAHRAKMYGKNAMEAAERQEVLLDAIEEEAAAARMRKALKHEAKMARLNRVERDARLVVERRRQEVLERKRQEDAAAKLKQWSAEYKLWRRGERVQTESGAQKAMRDAMERAKQQRRELRRGTTATAESAAETATATGDGDGAAGGSPGAS